ncbi:MAG: ArsR/SmtB family transcription factor [Coriobacteriia bacterium]
MHEQDLIAATRALGHPARMRIVRLLSEQAECRGAELFTELPLAQSTISEHLRILREAGLVTSHAVGSGVVYCLVPELLEHVAQSLHDLVRNTAACTFGTTDERITRG